MPRMSEILYRLRATEEDRQLQFWRSCAWSTLNNGNFIRSSPQRLVSGIAVSSSRKNELGTSFIARGANFTLPLPVLYEHRWDLPIGRVTGVSVVGDELHFVAEICNSGRLPAAEQVWRALKERQWHGVSVYGNPRAAAIKDNTLSDWTLVEISIVPNGADICARIVRVAEQSHVVSLHKPTLKVHWSEQP